MSKSRFRQIMGRREDGIFRVNTTAQCTDPKGVGKLRSRYLIPILFTAEERLDLYEIALDEAENQAFRAHLRRCVSCASEVYSMKELVRAEDRANERESRKIAIRAQLQIVNRRPSI